MKPSHSYYKEVSGIDPTNHAGFCFQAVFRTEVSEPGFAVLEFKNEITSFELRSFMIHLKQNLGQLLQAKNGLNLKYYWLGRFNQQASTKYHLDNAPVQSILMLGYEPSPISSELFIADYVQFAVDHGLTVSDFFEHHNPVFADNEKQMKPYITRPPKLSPEKSRIVLINNSTSEPGDGTLGVLHMAQIKNPDLSKSRIVNSIMLEIQTDPQDEETERQEEGDFLASEAVN
ncbi:MAG: hypothetical protein H6581_25690 [Bacteroidia bacterium]|nr:hypothetical protein [Bacteroidia bacterium]